MIVPVRRALGHYVRRRKVEAARRVEREERLRVFDERQRQVAGGECDEAIGEAERVALGGDEREEGCQGQQDVGQHAVR